MNAIHWMTNNLYLAKINKSVLPRDGWIQPFANSNNLLKIATKNNYKSRKMMITWNVHWQILELSINSNKLKNLLYIKTIKSIRIIKCKIERFPPYSYKSTKLSIQINLISNKLNSKMNKNLILLHKLEKNVSLIL